MKNLITLLAVCLLFANCKESGGGSADSVSTNGGKTFGNYIPDDYNSLGAIAKLLVDNDDQFDTFFHSINPQTGEKLYPDSQLVAAIRGYVHAKAKTPDANGSIDPLTNDKLAVFTETVYNGSGADRGLTREGLCVVLADVYNSFGIETSLFEATGATHTLASDGYYCGVELKLPNGNVFVDPLLNRTFFNDQIQFMSVNELLAAHDAGNVNNIQVSVDGMANAMPGWLPLNGYYHTLENNYPATADQWEAAREVQDSTFDTITETQYSDLR